MSTEAIAALAYFVPFVFMLLVGPFIAGIAPKSVLGLWIDGFNGQESPPWVLTCFIWPLVLVFYAVVLVAVGPRALGSAARRRLDQRRFPKARALPEVSE